MTRLIRPDELTLVPDPGRAAGATYARTRARALAAWRRGERELRVLARDGTAVAPEQIDWARVRADVGSGTPSSGRPAERVALATEAIAQLDALAARWCLSRSKAAARAIREATARSVPEIDDDRPQ